MKKYDSIIFGNGFNCAVDWKLANNTDEYKYLFELGSFVKKFIEFEKGLYSDKYLEIAKALLFNARNIRLKNICDRIQLYCKEDVIDTICNIETRIVELAKGFVIHIDTDNRLKVCLYASIILGKSAREIWGKYNDVRKLSTKECKKLEECEKFFNALLLDIFSLYNIHDIVKNYFVSKHSNLEDVRSKHYLSFRKQHLRAKAILMTTNYGNEIRNYYSNVEHMHGRFVDMREILSSNGEEIGRLSVNREDGYEKFLFAATAYKKHLVVEAGIYEDAFFINSNRNYGELLIYGISFAKIHGGLEQFCEKDRVFDMNIDSHIMKRIDELFKDEKLKGVTIVAYNSESTQNYRDFLESYEANEQTEISRWFKMGKIRIISNEEFVKGKIGSIFSRVYYKKCF